MIASHQRTNPYQLSKGFTVIELIFSLVLLGILALIFGMGITGALNVYAVSQENVYLAQKGQMAMARIHRELMELTAIIERDDAAPHILYSHPRGSGVHALRYDQVNKVLILYSDLPPTTTTLDPGALGQYADVLADQVNRQCRADPEQCYFFSKPVFIFWLMAASFRVFGVSDFAARLPMVLVGIAGLFAFYWYLRRMLGLRAGLIAAAVAATTPYYYLLSRQIIGILALSVPIPCPELSRSPQSDDC